MFCLVSQIDTSLLLVARFLLAEEKINLKKTATDRILASDCLYVFINFRTEFLFKVAHQYFFQLLCILKIKNELKVIVPFVFHFKAT